MNPSSDRAFLIPPSRSSPSLVEEYESKTPPPVTHRRSSSAMRNFFNWFRSSSPSDGKSDKHPSKLQSVQLGRVYKQLEDLFNEHTRNYLSMMDKSDEQKRMIMHHIQEGSDASLRRGKVLTAVMLKNKRAANNEWVLAQDVLKGMTLFEKADQARNSLEVQQIVTEGLRSMSLNDDHTDEMIDNFDFSQEQMQITSEIAHEIDNRYKEIDQLLRSRRTEGSGDVEEADALFAEMMMEAQHLPPVPTGTPVMDDKKRGSKSERKEKKKKSHAPTNTMEI